MPIMNGAQATAAIRKLGFDRLIFGLSGNALDDDRKTFLDSGANCVIPKPFRMAQLDALMKYINENGFKSDPSMTFVVSPSTLILPPFLPLIITLHQSRTHIIPYLDSNPISP